MANRFLEQVGYTPDGSSEHSGRPKPHAEEATPAATTGSYVFAVATRRGAAPNQNPHASGPTTNGDSHVIPHWWKMGPSFTVQPTRAVVIAALLGALLTPVAGALIAHFGSSGPTPPPVPLAVETPTPTRVVLIQRVNDSASAFAQVPREFSRMFQNMLNRKRLRIAGTPIKTAAILVPRVRPQSGDALQQLLSEGVGRVWLNLVYPPARWSQNEVAVHADHWALKCHVDRAAIDQWSSFRKSRFGRLQNECVAGGLCIIVSYGECDGDAFNDLPT